MVVIPFILALSLAGALFAQLEPGAVVAGTITSQVGNTPVRKAEVSLYRLDVRGGQHVAPLITQTDGEGRFLFPSVPSGHYRLSAGANGYEQVNYGARTSQQGGRLLLLGPNETRLDADIALRPTGVISGTVLDSEGDPLRHVQVSLLQTVYERGKPRYVPLSQAQTNDRGQYRIFGIRAGRYRMVATLAFAGPGVGRLYQPQFYPNAERLESSEVLDVTPGKEFRNVDFRLTAVNSVSLRGRLVPPPGVDLQAPVPAHLMNEGLPGMYSSSALTIAPPGFEFHSDGLRPGRYRFTANVRAGNRTYYANQMLDIGQSGLEGLSVPLEAPVDIKGTLKIEGSVKTKYSIGLLPGSDAQQHLELPTAAVNEDGTFVIPSVPAGVWDIEVRPLPRGGYLKSMMLGDEDVLTRDMTVTAATSKPLNIVVSVNGASVDGEVDIPQSHVGLEASVLLAPEGKLRSVLSNYTLRGINTEGQFHFEGVTPGSYRIYAFAELNHRSYQDPEFLKPFAELGVPVEVKEGDRIEMSKRVPLILPGVIPLE